MRLAGARLLAALVLVGMFAWIDRQHIRANDRRLLPAA